MSLEISLNNCKKIIELIEQDGNKVKVLIGKTEYELNVAKTSNGIYSILHDGKSYDISVVREKNHKNYIVNSAAHSYKVEIIDAETKFQKLKRKDDSDNGDNTIVSPMPGKIVKILVNEGQKIEAGETAIIISAMKMESEFKAKRKGVVIKINVKEGDIVEGGKKLIVIK